MRRWVFATALVVAVVCPPSPGGYGGPAAFAAAGLSSLFEQLPVVDGNKFAGLKWTFVRIKYGTYENEGGGGSRLAYWD